MRLTNAPTVALTVLASLGGMAVSESTERAMREAMGYAQRGARSLEKGNKARAAEDFKRALERVPDLPEAHAGLGHVAMAERRFEDALTEYRNAQEAFRKLSARRTELAQARYTRSRDSLQSMKDLSSQIEREEQRSQVMGGGGSSALKMTDGQMARTKAQYQAEIHRLESENAPALEVNETTPPATLYFYEANALFNLKRTGEAIVAWERAVARDPNYGVAFNNLAVAYWSAGRLDDAQASLERADRLGFKVNPNFRADLAKSIAGRGVGSSN